MRSYDDWKTTEPGETGFVCDGCRLMIPEDDAYWFGGEVYCPRCRWKYVGPIAEHDNEFGC